LSASIITKKWGAYNVGFQVREVKNSLAHT